MAEMANHVVIDYVEQKILIDGVDFPYMLLKEEFAIRGGAPEGEDEDPDRRMPIVYLPVMVDQSITVIDQVGTQVLKSPWFGQ